MVAIIGLFIFWSIPPKIQEIFQTKIFYNKETGKIDYPFPAAFPLYFPAYWIWGYKLFKNNLNNSQNEVIRELNPEKQILGDLAEVLILAWLSQTTWSVFMPGVRAPVPLPEPIQDIKEEELLKIFTHNVFFKEECPSLIQGKSLKIPEKFDLLPEKREKIKGVAVGTKAGDVSSVTHFGEAPVGGIKLLSKNPFIPIISISLNLHIEGFRDAAPTILRIQGLKPLTISSEKIECLERGFIRAIRGDEMRELQKWREIHCNILIEAKFRRLISTFHPRFNCYYGWIKSLFDDAKYYFDFPLYLKRLWKIL